ncbi:MAG: 30S ribosomal protein S10 [Candidatus Nomurabacteria bacterium GW2011_GWC2_41_8]|uniref:Small ribosomal subunit protein uS10 n=2 Tax=Candidatus Nomuraibacteriota TaxID=1752729 RepID=A0A0G1AGC0_9BACT|nr:MAG: 30S ribosomal protein S10 [Candidatus Nomurabacteria bacterium GW2011_GWA2_41_25]KKS24343.1 MAG: 30S ribosomal protein S10 [Candidatus Nomurabacteria bacterium GW2011_GWC2_41_8]
MTTTETKIKKPKVVKKTAVTKTTKIAKKSKVSPKKEKSVHISGSDSKVVLRIRVRAYESKILDASIKQIMDTAMRYDAVIVGPVPLPTEIKKYTVNRSPFIYKNTREQFEIRVHKRLIDIINPNAKTVEALTNLSLPSGVDIDVKMM